MDQEQEPIRLLLDNGSLRPEATLQLRAIALHLTEVSGRKIHPVSLLHSSKIDPEQLGGEPASTFGPFLRRCYAMGHHRFHIIPLFFGPSGALVDYIPERLRVMREDHPKMEVTIAPTLVNLAADSHPVMEEILIDHIRQARDREKLTSPAVVLVDHGTPKQSVNEIRNALGARLQTKLEGEFTRVAVASMERRKGSEFDFNEPLLEHVLDDSAFRGEVIVSMLFLLPGRHAGPQGDIAAICQHARQRHPQQRSVMTDLVGFHPRLIDLLQSRVEPDPSFVLSS